MSEPGGPPLHALAELVARVAQTLHGGADDAARARTAADVAELQALVAQVDRQAAGAFDLAHIADALRVFGDWLRTPTAAGEAEAERAMSELQVSLGPLIGWDPGREDAARRAQYRREARAALDDIFPVAGTKPDKA